MKVIVHPQVGLTEDCETIVKVVSDDIIEINGDEYDFSEVENGDIAEVEGDNSPFVGEITRVDGTLISKIIYQVPLAAECSIDPFEVNLSEGDIKVEYTIRTAENQDLDVDDLIGAINNVE